MKVGTTIMEKLTFSLGVAGTAMLIVFCLLLALMLIIKLQSYIINISGKKDKKPVEKVNVKSNDSIVEAAISSQPIDLTSDCELVAAIMAALTAHTGKSAGELNIRSIKRVNNVSGWRNASINK